jgi:phage-related protein
MVMTRKPQLKPLYWVASSLKDLRACPDDVQDVFGYALHLAQIGDKHAQAKPLKGFAGAGTLEVVEDHDGDTYRAVYTLEVAGAVYVLHVFEKKAKRGIKTPKRDMDLIKSRLKLVTAPPKGTKNDERRKK